MPAVTDFTEIWFSDIGNISAFIARYR